MINLVGWKRMELNQMISFERVSDAQFHSIFRRSLVIRIHGRFVDEESWAKNEDAARYGIFKRGDQDLKIEDLFKLPVEYWKTQSTHKTFEKFTFKLKVVNDCSKSKICSWL